MPTQRRPVIDRLMAKVEIDERSGCWLFWGARTPGGYGNLKGWEPDSRVYSHRYMFEHVNGPIPDGFELDHLCQTPPCCNPEHLELVTSDENHRRTAERRTHCPQGHEYVERNIYMWRGARYCRACRTWTMHLRQRNRKTAA